MELSQQLSQIAPVVKYVAPLQRIAHQVAAKHGFTFDQLKSGRKFGPLVAARTEFFYRALSETPRSLPAIARIMNVHKSTAAYGVRRYCTGHNLPFPRPGVGWVSIELGPTYPGTGPWAERARKNLKKAFQKREAGPALS